MMIMEVKTMLSVNDMSTERPAARRLQSVQVIPLEDSQKNSQVGDTLASPDLNKPYTEHLMSISQFCHLNLQPRYDEGWSP